MPPGAPLESARDIVSSRSESAVIQRMNNNFPAVGLWLRVAVGGYDQPNGRSLNSSLLT